jgi:hypothetical protein
MPFYNQITDNQGNVLILDQGADTGQVEPLGGVVTVDDLMDRFPDQIYQQGKDTHLYLLLTALCGDNGAGYLKRLSYAARLKNESELLVFKELDSFYQQVLRFPRLRAEIYDFDPSQIIPQTAWDEINNQDLAYRKRIMAFFMATRLGNSPQGMQLAAFSGSGVECEIIENYNYVFDLQSDDKIGVQYSGSTNSVFEYVINPRLQNDDGTANTDFAYKVPTIDVPKTNGTLGGYSYNQYPFKGVWAANKAYALNDVVVPTVDDGNFYQVTTAGTSGSAEPLTWDGSGTTASGTVVFTSLAGPDINPRGVWKMNPDIERNMVDVMDRLRPVGAFMNLDVRQQHYRPLEFDPDSVVGSSERFYVNRFVTGKSNVAWPATDAFGNYIVSSTETEVPKAALSGRDLPVIFHTLQSLHAYTDAALSDDAYDDGTFYDTTIDPAPYQKYRSEHVGAYNSVISSIYTFLKNVPNDEVFQAGYAAAIHDTPLVLEGKGK